VLPDVLGAMCLAELAIGMLVAVRLGSGPTVCDRIVALNTMSTQATLALLFWAAFAERTIYLDVAIWLGSFSYLGTIVWARYLERGLL
jgi:multicomponent Na+:H+ antiporter subunit F